MTPPTQRIGPALAIVGTCEGCEHLHPSSVGGARLGFVDCAHTARPVPFIGNVNTSITTPADCPLLPAARLALARAIVAEADAVLCSKCGKPVTTADEKSYRMHSMAGCPR